VDNTRDYARVSHSRQWSNYNIMLLSSGFNFVCRFTSQNQGSFPISCLQ